MTGTPLAVLPAREVRGLETEADLVAGDKPPVSMAAVGDFWDMIAEKHETDAHFVMYEVVGDEQWPRINKPGLQLVRDAGQDVRMNLLALDWDNEDHAEWDADRWRAFEQVLEQAEENSDLIRSWSAFYTTDHGARWVYVLRDSVPVEEGEEMLRGLQQHFRANGLFVDPLGDWTRLFRMPRVVRDGRPTWERPFHFLQVKRRTVLPNAVPHVPVEDDGVRAPKTERGPAPDPTTAKELLRSEDGKARSEWYRTAKHWLKGRECYPCIFDGEPLAPEGERNLTMVKYTGQVVALMHDAPGASPEKCYALLVGAVEQLDEKRGEEPWLDMLWRLIGHAWANQEAEKQREVKAATEKRIQITDTWDSVLSGVQEWCPLPELRSRDSGVLFLANKLILCTSANTFMVMTPDGFYDRMQVNRTQLVPRIKHLGMDGVIPLWRETQKGDMVPLKADELIDRHGYPIGELTAGPQWDKGGVVLGMGTRNPRGLMPMYQLNARLTPRYDADVDMWLKRMCPSEWDYDRLTVWIGHALDFHNPIAALALVGAPGVGKKLLVMGLAECLVDPKLVDFTGIVGDFQDALLQTPFVVANEGFPSQPRSGKRIADTLRELVSGDPITCNRKYKAPVLVQAHYRVIVTANNDSGLMNLYQGQDLTIEDREALAQRIVHVRASAAAANWLRGRGGLAYTGREGARWIAPHSGGESDHVVARHFLYLHENRPQPAKGSRFLVEGSVKDELFQEMTLNSGASPLVLEVLFDMLKAQGQPPEGLVVLDEPEGETPAGAYVSVHGIVRHWRRLRWPAHRPLNNKNVAGVLRGISTDSSRRSIRGTRAVWYRLDLDFLLFQAEQHGVPVPDSIRQGSET